MLHDDLNERPEANGPAPQRERASNPRAEREVEVPIRRRTTPAAVHAWLDGDLPEAAVRRGDTARDVEFWNRLNSEIDVRRRMKTPAYVYDQIMEALPQTTPTVMTPWWRRPLGLTPMQAALAAAGLVALGAALTVILG